MGALLDLVLPPRCPVCERAGGAPCASCWVELRPAGFAPPPAGVDRCRALLRYEGAGREVVARLKYRNARSALGWLVAGMAGLVEPEAVDAVTWAPTSPERRHERGFDQGELLARGVARCLGRPCLPLLRRAPGPPQTGRGRAGRAVGPTFTARKGGVPGVGGKRRAAMPARVLVVDDVLTTGATVSSAARALRAGGAREVAAVTAARTPLKVPRPPVDP